MDSTENLFTFIGNCRDLYVAIIHGLLRSNGPC